jgi:hypothetical protein
MKSGEYWCMMNKRFLIPDFGNIAGRAELDFYPMKKKKLTRTATVSPPFTYIILNPTTINANHLLDLQYRT